MHRGTPTVCVDCFLWCNTEAKILMCILMENSHCEFVHEYEALNQLHLKNFFHSVSNVIWSP